MVSSQGPPHRYVADAVQGATGVEAARQQAGVGVQHEHRIAIRNAGNVETVRNVAGEADDLVVGGEAGGAAEKERGAPGGG